MAYLKSKGFSAKGIHTGKESLRLLEKIVPKVILIDPILSDIDGFALCKMIKSVETFKHIPIFFFTTLPAPYIEKNMPNSDAEGYILKPFNLVDLDILFTY